jgi:serine/threonine-protein kinase
MVVNAALTKEIEVRYQSAEEMRVDLVDFARGRPLTFAYEPGPEEAPAEAAPPTVAAAVAQQVIPAPVAPRGRNWAGIVVALLGLGLLAVVVGYLLLNTGGDAEPGPPSVEVPTVIGRPFAEASAAMTAVGFVVSRVDDELSAQTPETVIGQDPGGGRLADEGSTVVLTVASTEVGVPDVVNQGYDAAAGALTQRQLVPARKNVDSDRPPGTVLASNPAAGTRVAKGTTVTLDVAAEPGVDVPNVIGQSQANAIAGLTFASLQPTVVPFPSDAPVGSAISTDPAPGTRVPKGSPITLVVSSGPAEVDVPIVVGATTQAAAQALVDAGFNVVVQQVQGRPPNIVFQQNPAGGKLTKGGTVTIFVGL